MLNSPISDMQRMTWAQNIADHLCESWGWLPGEPEAIQLGINIACNIEILVNNTNTSPEALLQGLLPLGKVSPRETREAYVLTQ